MITIHTGPGRSARDILAAVKPHGGHLAATDHGVTVSDETAAAWLAGVVEKPVRKATPKKTTKKPKTETPEGGEN